MQPNTHGKRHSNTQQHPDGRNLELDYLQRVCRLEQAESDIMMSHQLLISRLTAPMLLPHPTTRKPFFFRKTAAKSTSLLSFRPKVMNSLSSRLPHPAKSKQARPILEGNEFKKSVPQNLLEPFPWRQSMTYLMSWGLQRVSSKGRWQVSMLYFLLLLLLVLRMSGLQINLGGRMSMQANL